MEMLFTPAAVLELVAKIDELAEYEVGLTETLDGKLQLQVGESLYELEPKSEEDIEVDESVVNEIAEVNESAYEDLDEDIDVSYGELEPVESGIVKEAIKSMLLGGLIKLTAKAAPSLLK